jgi:heme exporter protein CcmD
MVNNEVLNSTVSAVSSFSDASFGWLVGILSFVVILLTFFSAFKFFRKFVIGIVPTIGIIVIIFVSKYIGASAGSGDLSPAKWLCYFVAFVVVSILIGHILAKKSKIVREMFEVEEEEKGK